MNLLCVLITECYFSCLLIMLHNLKSESDALLFTIFQCTLNNNQKFGFLGFKTLVVIKGIVQ